MARYGAVPNPANLLKKVQAPQVQPPAVAAGPPGPAPMKGGFSAPGGAPRQVALSSGFAPGGGTPVQVTQSPSDPPPTPGAAQRYFNSFGKKYQQNVTASFDPSKGDDQQKWFDNAVAAGAVNPDGSRKTAATAPGGGGLERGGGGAGDVQVTGGGGGGGGGSSATTVASSSSTSSNPLEQQLSEAITGMLGGSKAYGDDMISRYKAQAKSASEGQRRATVENMDEDLISRGLGRSGIAARGALDAGNKAGASYTQAVADLMNQKAGADEASRTAGVQAGVGLRQQQQEGELRREEMAMQRELASRGGGGGRKEDETFEFTDPETGDSYTLPRELLG